MSNVTPIHSKAVQEDELLEELKGEMHTLVVVGLTAEGRMIAEAAGVDSDRKTINWLLDSAKMRLFTEQIEHALSEL